MVLIIKISHKQLRNKYKKITDKTETSNETK